MKIQRNNSYYLFLMLLISLTIVLGCGERNKSSINLGKIEGKRPSENNSTHINEANIVAGLHVTHRHEVDASDSEMDQFVSPDWHKELARAFYLAFK